MRYNLRGQGKVRAEDGGKAKILLPHITYKKNIISITAAALTFRRLTSAIVDVPHR